MPVLSYLLETKEVLKLVRRTQFSMLSGGAGAQYSQLCDRWLPCQGFKRSSRMGRHPRKGQLLQNHRAAQSEADHSEYTRVHPTEESAVILCSSHHSQFSILKFSSCYSLLRTLAFGVLGSLYLYCPALEHPLYNTVFKEPSIFLFIRTQLFAFKISSVEDKNPEIDCPIDSFSV